MIILKGSTKRGQSIIEKFNSLRGKTKTDVYRNISPTFSNAYDKLYKKFEYASAFNFGTNWRCSYRAGSWSWSCGYEAVIDNKKVVIYFTRENEYMVMVNE